MDAVFSLLVDAIGRVLENMGARVTGPMRFRLVLQPAMALYFAVRAGVLDAKNGRPPYLRAIFTEPEYRRALLREEWHAVRTIFLLAILIDVVYQVVVERWVYPGEALLVAVLLAFVPYLVARGLVTRIVDRARTGLDTRNRRPA